MRTCALVVALVAGCGDRTMLSETQSAVVVGSEFALDPPVPAREPGDQKRPEIACVGTECLVVWSHIRSGMRSVQGARVDAVTGAVLDTPWPFTVTPYFVGGSEYPSVACAGTDCIVVWQDVRNAGIYGARVDLASGAVADSDGVAIAAGAYQPMVSCCATSCLVVWDSSLGPRARRISQTTAALEDLGDIALPFTLASSVACTGTDWLVLGPREGVRVSGAGAVLDAPPFAIQSADAVVQGHPAVACTGSNCLIAWPDRRNGGTDVYGARFDAATPGLSDANDIAISTALYTQSDQQISCDGNACMVVWEDFRIGGFDTNVYGARVDLATGAIADPAGIPIYTTGYASALTRPDQHPDVGCAANRCVVAWHDYLFEEDVYASRFEPATATVIDPNGIIVARAPNIENAPVAECVAGGPCLVAWIDGRDRFERGFGVRVDPEGQTVLDANATQWTTYGADHLRVSCGATRCLLVYSVPAGNMAAIYATRLDRATGVVIGSTSFAVAASYDYNARPDVACAGDSCMVVWTRLQQMFGTRVDLISGVVSDPGGVLLTAQAGSVVALGCDGPACLLMWSGTTAGASRLDLATGALTGSVLAIAGTTAVMPAVACAGTSCLVTWAAQSANIWKIDGAYVDLANDMVYPLALPTTGIDRFSRAPDPSVACEGNECVAVWQTLNGSQRDLVAARIDKQARTVLDPSGFELTSDADVEGIPTIAVDGIGNFLVTYTRPEATIDRAKARVLVLRPPGRPCSDDAQCFATSCVSGVCGGTPSDDAGISIDAGDDATILGDANNSDATADGFQPLPNHGCGCSSTSLGGGWMVVGLVAFAVRRRRRR